jgi:hypothetical protein
LDNQAIEELEKVEAVIVAGYRLLGELKDAARSPAAKAAEKRRQKRNSPGSKRW